MPYHHGLFGRRVDGGEHRGQLLVEGSGGSSVTLTRQGERHRTVAEIRERGHHLVPCGSVEPQAGNEQDVHDQFSLSGVWFSNADRSRSA